MKVLVLPFLLLFLRVLSASSFDESLPVYMRGVNWEKVQEVLKEDLRLSNAVKPLNYGIDLSVNVRGHSGAPRSDFNGTVTIELNFTRSTDTIELHSNGLNIEKVALLEWVVLKSPPNVTKFVINQQRESLLIFLNRTVSEGEEFLLEISYSGVATMNEYGLYENWDPKFNQTSDHRGPFVLATNNFPTGARFWFPCFDEPQIKATFELRVNHPKSMNAYSNTELQQVKSVNNRTVSVFAKTQLLSTDQLSLSVNHFEVGSLGNLHGFKKVRVISSLNNPEKDIKEVQRNFINKNLEHLKNALSTLIHGISESLDVIILDGTHLITVNPGLMTIGRYNLFRDEKTEHGLKPVSNFTNLFVGSQVSADLKWFNDMLAKLYTTEFPLTSSALLDEIPHELYYSSLHERPLRHSFTTFTTTTNQYLSSKRREPSLKASQLISSIYRLCPETKKAIEKFIIETRGKIADIDLFIKRISQACKNSEDIEAILKDFIDQPGRALLTVTRANDTVEIRQERYLSVNFDGKLRDAQIIADHFGANNSSFHIDDQYDRLYFVHYKDALHYNNITESTRARLQYMHRKSLIAALEHGAVNFDEFVEHAKHYVSQKVFNMFDVFPLFNQVSWTLDVDEELPADAQFTDEEFEEYMAGYCASLKMLRENSTSWDGLFNNDTSRYWQYSVWIQFEPTIDQTSERNMVQKISCLREWHNSTTYLNFLEKNFLGDSTQIRPGLVKYLSLRTGRSKIDQKDQWKELHQFLFRNFGNNSDPRWNLLADAVLNDMPEQRIADDYLKELRNFIIRNPRAAASMSNEIEMRLEREFIRRERPKWHGVDYKRWNRGYQGVARSARLRDSVQHDTI